MFLRKAVLEELAKNQARHRKDKKAEFEVENL